MALVATQTTPATTRVRAVAYLRRSTKDQAQSLERQRHDLERHAAATGLSITTWYVDDGISGVEDGAAARPGFAQMVAAAERREFDLILVHEISRFGRFDAFQSGSWLHRLKAARVRVQAIEGTVRDPYSVQGKLMLALEQDRGESVKLSMRTLSGQRETALRGLRAGGKVPYGFSRRRTRGDGSVRDEGRVGRAKLDKADKIELVPGDPAEIETVRTMFRLARDGTGYRSIAAYLNDRGVPSPDRVTMNFPSGLKTDLLLVLPKRSPLPIEGAMSRTFFPSNVQRCVSELSDVTTRFPSGAKAA